MSDKSPSPPPPTAAPVPTTTEKSPMLAALLSTPARDPLIRPIPNPATLPPLVFPPLVQPPAEQEDHSDNESNQQDDQASNSSQDLAGEEMEDASNEHGESSSMVTADPGEASSEQGVAEKPEDSEHQEGQENSGDPLSDVEQELAQYFKHSPNSTGRSSKSPQDMEDGDPPKTEDSQQNMDESPQNIDPVSPHNVPESPQRSAINAEKMFASPRKVRSPSMIGETHILLMPTPVYHHVLPDHCRAFVPPVNVPDPAPAPPLRMPVPRPTEPPLNSDSVRSQSSPRAEGEDIEPWDELDQPSCSKYKRL